MGFVLSLNFCNQSILFTEQYFIKAALIEIPLKFLKDITQTEYMYTFTHTYIHIGL